MKTYFSKPATFLRLSLLSIILFPLCLRAQVLYVPSGTSGIGSAFSTGNVGIGTSSPGGKLGIYNYGSSYTHSRSLDIAHFDPGNYAYPHGIELYLVKQGSGGTAYGIDNYVTNSSTGYTSTYGLYSTGYQPNGCSGMNVGVYAYASGGNPSYGLYAAGYSSCSGAVKFAGYFSGSIKVNSTVYSSDQKLKQDIRPLESALDKILQLEVSEYQFKTEEYPHMNLPEGRQIGFMAQQMETVLPQLVAEAIQPASDPEMVKEGVMPAGEEVHYKGVDYAAVVPYLTRAMQEQQEMIAQLQAELKALRAIVEKGSTPAPTGHSPISPRHEEVQLFQNSPNPFDQSTTIRYFLPESAASAALVIRNVNGSVVRTISLNETGHGNLLLQAGELAAGVYLYSLEVNGETVDSKRLVISQ